MSKWSKPTKSTKPVKSTCTKAAKPTSTSSKSLKPAKSRAAKPTESAGSSEHVNWGADRLREIVNLIRQSAELVLHRRIIELHPSIIHFGGELRRTTVNHAHHFGTRVHAESNGGTEVQIVVLKYEM